jgi:2,4-dienoyl-CoA reductase-like NADH-dependent reductase (Old Yellow Enzyme family)
MEGMASDDGSPSSELIELYSKLAAGGVALVSTSACHSDRTWVPNPKGHLYLDTDDTLLKWEKMVKEVHQAGAKISLQLGPFFIYKGKPVGPSAYRPVIHELEPDEIRQLIVAIAAAAQRAQKVGFDIVQAHAGHGYPISQFISPFYNKRTDQYGGSPENRARILVEIRQAIADRIGKDFPVWIKMNSFDGQPGGMTPADTDHYGKILSQAGYSAIEVSGGSPGGTHDSRGPLKKEDWFEGFYLQGALRVKANTDLPVSAVGGIRRWEMIDRIISENMADLISLSRPLIRETNLINRWLSGDLNPATCISCNGCSKLLRKGQAIRCVQEKI